MLLGHVLGLRSQMRARERWTRGDLDRHQKARLCELLTFARARSPFYRELHAGLEKAPLDSLPVVTKTMLMDQFDRVVTDPLLHRAEIEAQLTTAGNRPYLGRPWITATSGSTGRPGLFLFDRTVDDVHASGIFHKSVGRLHVQVLSERLSHREPGLTSIAKDARDLARLKHCP